MDEILRIPNAASLLPEVTFDGNGLFWNKQHVSNFIPVVMGRTETTCEGISETVIKLMALFTDRTQSKVKDIPLSEIGMMKWIEFDIKCQINPDCPKANKYLAAVVQADLQTVEAVNEVVVNRTGAHFIGGQPIFCVGDRVILSPYVDKSINIKLDSISNRLVVDSSLSEREALFGMARINNLTPEAGNIIFSQCLLGVMRAVYAHMDKPPRCIVKVVGKTGTKKTTYAAFQTQLFDRNKGIEAPVRLNASIPAAEAILNGKHDCVAVLDDLFPARSSETKSKQEHTLIELVRIIGDNVGRARVRGKEVVTKDPQCGVLILISV